MTRLLLLVALVAGCGYPGDREAEIAHCNRNGYFATTERSYLVLCCSHVNGNDVCLPAQEVTRHRRETGQ